MSTENKKAELTIYGMPWWLFAGAVGIILTAAYTNSLGGDMLSIFAVGFAFAAILNEIGERLPIWNEWIGGGLLMVFLGASLLNQFGIIPERHAAGITGFITGSPDFLTFFIVMLVTGSILALEKEVLIKSFAGYLPTITGAFLLGSTLAIGGGLLFGVSPSEVIVWYALPILGGGTGAGVVPMSQMYEQITGEPAGSFFSFTFIIITIANVMCIVIAALIHRLGQAFPYLTGDRKTLLRKMPESVASKEPKAAAKYTIEDLGAALFIGLACFAMGRFFSRAILPSIAGSPIHHLAYMVLFIVILAATGIVPPNIVAAAKRLSTFFTNVLSILIMMGMGIGFDIMELAEVFTLAGMVITTLCVLGALLGAASIGYLMGFYPIDAGITAGLCMANRGGNGDIATLGASDRMELMAYAQLSTRLGGALVLMVAGFAFSVLL